MRIVVAEAIRVPGSSHVLPSGPNTHLQFKRMSILQKFTSVEARGKVFPASDLNGEDVTSASLPVVSWSSVVVHLSG
jgi:hypothetical protein